MFNYPLPLAINKKDKINVLYGKISNYLKVFSPEKYKNEEAININSEYSQINKDNEKNNGFLIYLNIYLSN